jgi:hypothetical protein
VERGNGIGGGVESACFAHDEQFLAVDLDLGAGILAEQHLVASLDGQRAHLAVLEDLAGADGDDLALDRLLGCCVWNDDAAGRLGFGLQALDDHAVVQRTKLHNDFLKWLIDNEHRQDC